MNKNILILEDEENAIKIYTKVLENYNLHFASSIRDALTLIEGNNTFDLFIIDMSLRTSKFSGDMLIPFCGSKPVIIATALDLRFAIKEKYENAVYIRKPIRNENLKNKIKELLGKAK